MITDESFNLIDLHIDLDRRINFAMQQNDVPVIKALTIRNKTSTPLKDIEIRITCEPAFANTWTQKLSMVGSEADYNYGFVDLQLLPSFLEQLTERLRGLISVEAWAQGDKIGQVTVQVDLLACDEWNGLSSLPEILAAFVLPNHPIIEQILRSASEFMNQWTGDPSLNGYQSKDPKRVHMMAGAVYAALQKLDLTYINPPASFEDDGQRVRLPDQIIESRMSTCLDIALLAVACLEQLGLNALIVLVKGHAFSGLWLRDECFPEPALEDVLRLRKRVDLSEITVFDPTGVTSKPVLSFDRSIEEAKGRLYNEEQFCCTIDIKRSRKGRIRPLPLRVARSRAIDNVESIEKAPDDLLHAPDVSRVQITSIPDVIIDLTDPIETPSRRIDRWCRKLLDLTLRNRLLNFKESKKTLTLLCPDPGRLEDMLASDVEFNILPKPRDLGDQDPRNAETHQRRTGQKGIDEVLLDELKAKRLRSNTTEDDLNRRLVEIYREARLGLEEGGASALYLAIGFLTWYETEKSEQKHSAPILLLPIDLKRKSIQEGFSLKMASDEPRLNVTLLEMLKQDFEINITGLDPLPLDDSGLDLGLILDTVKRAVRDIDRWEVVEEVKIGLFSFTKFLMWRDLSERTKDLLKNTVVDHLVNHPDQKFDPEGKFSDPEKLDDEKPPTETYCPLPADSSQLAAVFAAANGRSFVLEGPPGTGKSQTITNLIAHCLTEGKTVLFVSEKMAALNVVHRRLERVGLGQFCLELHSNKANKGEVIRQVYDSLQRQKEHDQDTWRRYAQQVGSLRNDLNAYVRALHKKRSTGETVFKATSRLIGHRNIPRVDLRWSSPDSIDANTLAEMRDMVDRLAISGDACGEMLAHPWSAARKTEWTPVWEDNVCRAIDNLRSSTLVLIDCLKKCSQSLGFDNLNLSLSKLNLIKEITIALLTSLEPPTSVITYTDWESIHKQVDVWIQHGKARDELRTKMREQFKDEIIKLDLDTLAENLDKALKSWWPASWWRGRPVIKALKSVAVSEKMPQKAEIAKIIDQAKALRQEQNHLDAASDTARELFGQYWNDGEAVWDKVNDLRDWGNSLRSLALKLSDGDIDKASKYREHWATLAYDNQAQMKLSVAVLKEFEEFSVALEEFKQTRKEVSDLLDLDIQPAWGAETDIDALGRVTSNISVWHNAIDRLRYWCAWRRACSEAIKYNLMPLISAFEQGKIQADQFRAIFERSFAQWWVNTLTDQEPALRQFTSPEHERKIKQFRQIDDLYTDLTRSLIKARLYERAPATNSASFSNISNSEVGILMREFGKKRRQMPIRQLLQTIPNLLPRLKPCLLMSPMSVAQYLDPQYPLFDVVVFDEASQIPVWDAVGAIARGRQAIVVGDPKQLPPTNFFQRMEEGDEETADDVVEDLESMIDECISAQIPWLHLEWHYRSRHESLIAFSNYHYYGNRLLTFPSPSKIDLGISWRHVPGVYDKGKTRTNKEEAKVIVDEILHRLRDDNLSQFSIGVVTFNQAQQTLIEDLLEKERAEDPGIDSYFSDDREEPVFIKNLENVQGDERDVILFSICYGPDIHGNISMNFGPMNKDGGERRLNVAITRARREVIVFSTLRAEDIDLARTRARGVTDLKNFLEYAGRGPSAIAQATQLEMDADFDSPFEESVYGALVGKGWEVHKQVGCARYRIDLAVVDPRSPGRYLMGVECDGANYHRAKTARDRDKLREGILRDLGWKLYRIWSTDWWRDPGREINKLDEVLKEALKDNTTERTSRPSGANDNQGNKSSTQNVPFAEALTIRPIQPNTIQKEEPKFEKYQPTSIKSTFSQNDVFYDDRFNNIIRDILLEVVKKEAPIMLELATRRVVACWGIDRITQKMISRVRSSIKRPDILIEKTEAGECLWYQDYAQNGFTRFRVPDTDTRSVRQIDEIPLQEIGSAALYILKQHLSVPTDDLVRETARLFNISRSGRVVKEHIQKSIKYLNKKGLVRVEDDLIILV